MRQHSFRQKIAKSSTSTALSSSSLTLNPSSTIVLAPPIYIGALPQIIDPSLPPSALPSLPPDDLAIWTHLEDKESTVNHSQLCISLLSNSIAHLPANHTRRHCHLHTMLAQQHIIDNNPNLALPLLANAIKSLVGEGWFSATVPLLRKQLDSAWKVGAREIVLTAALCLYSPVLSQLVSRKERECLFDIVKSVINPSSLPPTLPPSSPPTLNLGIFGSTAPPSPLPPSYPVLTL